MLNTINAQRSLLNIKHIESMLLDNSNLTELLVRRGSRVGALRQLYHSFDPEGAGTVSQDGVLDCLDMYLRTGQLAIDNLQFDEFQVTHYAVYILFTMCLLCAAWISAFI